MSRFLRTEYQPLKAYVPGEQPRDMAYIKLNTNESP
jgi:histidinol-phosphate aminotransferase